MSRVLIDISILLNILGFGQGLFLCFSLWRSKKNKPENIYLIFLLIAISVIILNAIIRLSDYISILSFFEKFSNSFLLIIAPSIFLFIKSRTNQQSLKKVNRIHYLPFILYFGFNIIGLVYKKSEVFADIISMIAYITFNIQFIVYFILSLLKLNIIDELSGPLKWIRIAIWLIIIPWLLQLAFLLAQKIFGIFISDFFTLNLALMFGICAFFLSYVHASGTIGFSKKDKYEDSKLSATVLKRNLEIITLAINQEKLFLDRDLSLSKVSEKTQLSIRDVSLTINQATGQNFVDFINGYRIEAFKQLIRQSSSNNFTMVAIAEQCGFKSSSAFYAAFKKQTGITPKQYKDNLAFNS